VFVANGRYAFCNDVSILTQILKLYPPILQLNQPFEDFVDIPEQIRMDNVPEFVAQAIRKWCEGHNIDLVNIKKAYYARTLLLNGSIIPIVKKLSMRMLLKASSKPTKLHWHGCGCMTMNVLIVLLDILFPLYF